MFDGIEQLANVGWKIVSGQEDDGNVRFYFKCDSKNSSRAKGTASRV